MMKKRFAGILAGVLAGNTAFFATQDAIFTRHSYDFLTKMAPRIITTLAPFPVCLFFVLIFA